MTSLFFNKLRAVSREAIAVCAACVILIGCGGGGGGGDGTPAAGGGDMTGGGGVMMPPVVMPPVVMTPDPMTPDPMMPEPPVVMPPVVMPPVVMPPVVMPPTPLTFTASAGANTFAITTDLTGSSLTPLESVIDGLTGDDTLQLNTGAVVASIAFANTPPTGGVVNLQNIETITIDGGTVNGNIDASAAPTAVRFNLMSGTVMGDITGSAGDEQFFIMGDLTSGDLNITGVINGAGSVAGNAFTLASGGVVRDIAFSAENPAMGDVHLRNISNIFLRGGTVNNITGSTGSDRFFITGDLTSDDLNINGIIDGGDAADVFVLDGGVVNNIAFTAGNPAVGDVHLRNIENISLRGGTVNNITGSTGTNRFTFTGDLTGDDLNITGVIDGGGNANDDQLILGEGGVVNNIAFAAGTPTAGDVHLQNIEDILINGGTVNGNITGPDTATTFRLTNGTITGDVRGGGGDDTFRINSGIIVSGTIDGGGGADTFNLQDGTITGNVLGGGGADVFNLFSAIAIGGFLDGGAGTDTLNYTGATAGTDFTARGGLAADSNTNDTAGDVRNIEAIADVPNINSIGVGAGLRGLTVRGIEVLDLSPALNLYGAMSDALMQFGAQTAQGFALADLDLSTGRGTSLASKDSPFSKGRLWAHKITHSGNGKGSIGLNLTGLTARADSDYDYEMSLTQHGFDAPVATTKLGAFNLRAVSHTMIGVIETNVAEANVSGYGAGVALLWRGQNLAAHLTSLAGAYEVEAHTSPLNPRAVVNEVSEGSFSAINAVVSAGVADTRKLGHSLVLRTTADIVWQTLSLDDFNETSADGIAINFDKATRFTARVGAGLESEHWFSDVAFVHETSSGGTLSSGLSQDYRQDDGTAIEMKLGGKIADLATGLTLKAYVGLRTSLINGATLDPSARFDLSWRF